MPVGRSTRAVPPPPLLSDADTNWQGWLRALGLSLWLEHVDPRTGRPWSTNARRFTAEEWERFKQVLDEHSTECFCHLVNACMGFGCGMYVFEVPPHVYPGADVKPECLIFVDKNHLPLPVRDGKLDDRTTFEDGWEAFSPYTHSAANAAKLVAYKFDAPREKYHYDY